MKQFRSFTFLLLSCLLLPLFSSAHGASSTTVGGAYLVFAQKMGGKVTPEALQSACELGVAGCAKGSRVFSFKLTIIHRGKRTTYEVSSSNELSEEMKSSLARLKAGDSFQFKQIKAYLPNGRDKVDVFAKRFEVV